VADLGELPDEWPNNWSSCFFRFFDFTPFFDYEVNPYLKGIG
jgi:hypothetical protein